MPTTPPPAYQPPLVAPFDVNNVPANIQPTNIPILPAPAPPPALLNAVLPAPPAPVAFELTLSVVQPAKRVRTAAKRTKSEKAEVLSIGPVNCNTALDCRDCEVGQQCHGCREWFSTFGGSVVKCRRVRRCLEGHSYAL